MQSIRENTANHPIWKVVALLIAAVVGSGFLAASPAKAGLVDRLQDIYKAPDKLEEIQSEYNQAKEEMNRQAEQFAAEREDMQKRTEALEGQNEALSTQNESLASQNAALMDRLEQQERKQEKKGELTRRVMLAVGTVLALGMLYFLSIRMWRFAVWRRHHRISGGQSQ